MHLHPSTYTIYNASAGSGKTFTLAKDYLKLLITANNPEHFKHILAITFTNKAVGEMKERIIKMLTLFSEEKHLENPNPMFLAIVEELNIAPKQLHIKSKNILNHIIQNYGAFHISTIDGFTHQVIRTFAHDLKLAANFEVSLDQNALLAEAVDNLIAKAGNDQLLTKTLIDFAVEKTDDDKSWDISYDFYNIANLLVNELDLPYIETLKDKTLTDFNTLKTLLNQKIETLKITITNTAKSVLELIEHSGLLFEDFNRKYLPNHFYKLSEGVFNLNFETNWQQDLLEGNTLYPKRVSPDVAEIINSIQPTLTEAFSTTKTLVFDLKLHQALLKNITPLSVVMAIKNELNAIKQERNVMLISEFNNIISQQLKNQPTPFIYERLGEKFKHYFIDEFQDTSVMQWQNLVPLLSNALSGENGSAMLVGDAKQAIYRWRGGDANQFINLSTEKSNPFSIKLDLKDLNTNFRSSKTVIEFNNNFFNYLGHHFFNDATHAHLYQNAKQQINSTIEGYVNLNFLDFEAVDDVDLHYAEATLNTIKQCTTKGYLASDICILVRKKKEGVAIANYLSEQGYEITSSETLLINNSEDVQFLNAVLQLLIETNNQPLQFKVLTYLVNQLDIEDHHAFFSTYIKKDTDAFIKGLEQLDYYLNRNYLLQLPLYELVETLIRAFNLHNTSNAYVQFYLDVVFEFTQQQHATITSFLNYFETQQDKLSIVSPKNKNAIQIMTIHKSKGLEFPVVIFPYAALNIYRELDPKIWFPINKDNYNGFSHMLINYTKDVAHFGEVGDAIFNEQQAQLQLDNINLLYVALTRASQALFVISKKDFSSKGEVNKNTYSGLLIQYLQHIGLWQDAQLQYDFGTLLHHKKDDEKEENTKTITLHSSAKENHNLSIVTKHGLLWDTQQEKAIEQGNLVHLILSKIRTAQDVAMAFETLKLSGEITEANQEALLQLVNNVITHPKLKPFFGEGYTIYNEVDIISPSENTMRPDRINIDANNNAIIIDYKTGQAQAQHQAQLSTYQTALKAMQLNVSQKLLVYINDSVEVVAV